MNLIHRIGKDTGIGAVGIIVLGILGVAILAILKPIGLIVRLAKFYCLHARAD